MANFDDFKQKAKDTIETIADKSVELYKIAEEKTKILAKMAKLSAEITFEKGNVRKLYRELGKMYYDLNKTSPELVFAQTCVEITSSLDVISIKQKEIDELKGCAEYEPVQDDDTDEKDDAEVAGAELGSVKTVQDTDDLEEPESDAIIGKTPPFTL